MKRRLAVALLALASTRLLAQDQAPPRLDAVVIVGERTATPINRSTAAITRVTAADLARLPYASVAEVLRRVPGFAIIDFDGAGRDPQLMARGFYGGGEAEYVLVMVDGRVVNNPHNGTVTWDALPPLSSIESIEVVSGSASAVHGDAAVAGVINIVTRRAAQQPTTWRLGAESFEGISASAEGSAQLLNRDAFGSVGFDRTDGYRDHASRTAATAAGSWRYNPWLQASAQYAWRDFEEPGPLLASLRHDGSESDPRFADDGGDDREWRATVMYDGVLGAGATTHTTFRGGHRSANLTRTLPLSPDFGDTRERELRTTTYGVTLQADANSTILPIDQLSLGISADHESIDSRYFSHQGNARALDARGDGSRTMLSAFALVASSIGGVARWNIGLRADHLNDSFLPEAGATDYDASHFAFSPKAGLNIRYAAGGRAWVSVARTFKAPTPDQLFDQRPIPVPFPPFSISTSNPDLDAQRGTSVEAGAYHDLTLGAARVSLTVTGYQITMKDELDFDLQTFRYVNLARSRHSGTELGANVSRGIVSGFLTLGLHNAVSRAGANIDKQLKAVPGQTLTTGFTVGSRQGAISASLTRMADMWIDDANTRRIPSWTRVDMQVSRELGSFAVVIGARNLFDRDFNSSAFLDPSGSGQAYVYPAAGRVFTVGLRHGR